MTEAELTLWRVKKELEAIETFNRVKERLGQSPRAKEAAERSDRGMKVSESSWHRHGKRGPGEF